MSLIESQSRILTLSSTPPVGSAGTETTEPQAVAARSGPQWLEMPKEGAHPEYFSRGAVGRHRGFPRCGALAAAPAPSGQGQSRPPILLLQPGSPNLRAFRHLEPRVRGAPVFSCAGGCFSAQGHLEWATPLGHQCCFFPLLKQDPMSWLDVVNSKVQRQGLCQSSFLSKRFHRRQDSGQRLL